MIAALSLGPLAASAAGTVLWGGGAMRSGIAALPIQGSAHAAAASFSPILRSADLLSASTVHWWCLCLAPFSRRVQFELDCRPFYMAGFNVDNIAEAAMVDAASGANAGRRSSAGSASLRGVAGLSYLP